MKTLEFFQLSRAVQDRFKSSAQGLSQPRPALFSATTDTRWRLPLAASFAILLATLGVFSIGFGRSDSPLAIEPVWMVAVYAGLLLLALVSLVLARVRKRAPLLLPYRPGVYLFPFGVLDASNPAFRHLGLEELEAVEALGGDLLLKFKQGQFRFHVGQSERAQSLVASVEAAKIHYTAALKQMNLRDLAALDPLSETGFSNPFSPKGPHERPSQRAFVRLALLCALPLSLGLGWAGLKVRNRLSESRLFEQAKQSNQPSAYRTYLARGGTHPSVSDTLLPRAELAVASRAGNVPALEAFMQTHPGSKIQSEVTAALKGALLTELERAKAKGSLTALRSFAARFAAHGELFRAEYARGLSALYAGVLTTYKRSANYSPKALRFVKLLLDFSKTFEGTADVRFRRALRSSMTAADRQVQKSIYYMGPDSVPSQYFDRAHSEPREARAGAALVEQWQTIFPTDVLKFSLGPAVTEPEGTPVAFKVPTLLVEYVVGGAGIYLSRKPRGVVVGVGLVFDAKFTLPDSAESLEFKSSSWKVPDLAGTGEVTVAGVYEGLATEGFERFLRLYSAEYFRTQAEPTAP